MLPLEHLQTTMARAVLAVEPTIAAKALTAREVDPRQPRVDNCGWKSRFRHYTNLSRMSSRLGRLLHDFAWDRMDRVFSEALQGAAA